MIPFATFHERAIARHGEDDLRSRFPRVITADELRTLPDHRYLSAVAEPVTTGPERQGAHVPAPGGIQRAGPHPGVPMAASPEVRAQFDAVLRSGAFLDPKTLERLVDRLMKSGKVDLALELLELASADPRLERQLKNISDIRERLLDSKMPRF